MLRANGGQMLPMEALLKVLRLTDQIEDGLEDAELDEGATHECQELGWLDQELMLTREGREVLQNHQESPRNSHS